MSIYQPFLDRCTRYCERQGIAQATLSTKILGNGVRLQQLAEGRLNIGIATLEDASQKLATLESALEQQPCE